MTQAMTYDGCKGHAGYLDSMRLLPQRQDLKSFPAVGYRSACRMSLQYLAPRACSNHAVCPRLSAQIPCATEDAFALSRLA